MLANARPFCSKLCVFIEHGVCDSVLHAEVLQRLHDTVLRRQVQRQDVGSTLGGDEQVLLSGRCRLRLRHPAPQLRGEPGRRTNGWRLGVAVASFVA